MISLLSIVVLGFFLGMRHATDPDHVIAVSTIVTRQLNVKKSALIGVFWGVGHTLTILVVGAAIILFNLVIPARLGLTMELAVGLMLVFLGWRNVTAFIRPMPEGAAPAHTHSHVDGDLGHSHEKEPAPVAWLDRMFVRSSFYQPLRPLIIGVVHGLAGSAAVALLVLATIRDPWWAVAYLLLFGLGTIAGMMLITLTLASAFHAAGKNQRFSRGLSLASGLISLAFGLVIAYQICVANGLLSGHPMWSPK